MLAYRAMSLFFYVYWSHLWFKKFKYKNASSFLNKWENSEIHYNCSNGSI